MRQLHPRPIGDVDPIDCYAVERPVRPDRAYVFVNMVASVDGGTVVAGVSGGLGSAGDRRIFFLLRSLADGILVGAETVRAEGYGPPRPRAEYAAARAERGQAPVPRIAVVTRSLGLDWGSPLFTQPTSRPLVLAPADAPEDRLRTAGQVADLVTTPGENLDVAAALATLKQMGIDLLLCEGGPSVNTVLLAAGLVDELCLTVAPTLLGTGGGSRILGGGPLRQAAGLELAHVLEEDGNLYLRYLVAHDGAGLTRAD